MVIEEKKIAKRHILIVDDEKNVRESLEIILSRSYEVKAVDTGEKALEHIRNSCKKPDLVLLDVFMPGIDGMEVLEGIKKEFKNIPVIMLTASSKVQTVVQAMKFGAVDYLNKPYDVDELLSLIEETLKDGPKGRTSPSVVVTQNHLRKELPFVEGDLGGIVGKHLSMKKLYSKIHQLASRDTTVLISGDSGTGKELVAREIHRLSSRANEPFVALNCAAIPETLIESELFGHEKGSFTHAMERRVGHFELANGGTLLLDEIGELSLSVQVKMLRFLQEKEFYRVGCSNPIKVDVRILAATNKKLEDLIKEGRFRQDLFYRINVVSLSLPSLKDRKEDIPNLVSYFLKRLSPIYSGRSPKIDKDALEALSNYSWPGNVRELENVIESILALCNKDVVTVKDLPKRIKLDSENESLKEDVLNQNITFEDAEKAFETEIIVKALKKSSYVQTKAAELLGISRRILKYKMDKLGIDDKPI